MMARVLAIAIATALSLFLVPVVASQVHAASLNFDSTSATLGVGETIAVPVVVDAAGELITSIDAYVTYDATVLEAVSVTDGTFFPTVFTDITTSRVYVAGLVSDPATYRENTGTVATINFKALTEGSTTLAYKCETGAAESSKVIKNDFNATNIITCSENGSLAVTVGAGSSTTVPTEAPTELPQTGIMDKLIGTATAGGVLVTIGLLLRFLL